MGGMETVVSAAATGLQMVSQHNQAKASAQAQVAQVNQQNQLALLQQQQQAKQQRDLLKRQMASTRAALAAGGGSASDGSGAALLNGLAKQTEENIADGYETLALRDRLSSSASTSADGAGAALTGLTNANKVWGVMKSFL